MPKSDILGLEIELPDDWRGIQAVWMGPLVERKSTGLLAMSGAVQFRPNLALSITPNVKVSIVEFLDTLIKTMEVQGVKTEPHEIKAGQARAEVVTGSPTGTRVRQILHGFSRTPEAWVLAYSFLDGQGDAKDQRAFFEKTLASLKMAKFG